MTPHDPQIRYLTNSPITAEQLADLFVRSGIHRPTNDLDQSNDPQCQPDYYCLEDQSMLLLLSAPEAMVYYPKIGMEPVQNGWIIKRAL